MAVAAFYKNPWLEKHIEEFVKPAYKDWSLTLPSFDPDFYKKAAYAPYAVNDKRMKQFFLCWEVVKRYQDKLQKPILFPGRDSFIFAVMAGLDGNKDHVFKPEFSGTVTSYAKQLGFDTTYANHYALDSGYSGSVPRKLGITKHFHLVRYGGGNRDAEFPQLPPPTGMTFSQMDDLAFCMEGQAYYWVRAEVTYDVPSSSNRKATGFLQPLDKGAFSRCYQMVLMLAEAWYATHHMPIRERHVRTVKRALVRLKPKLKMRKKI